MSNENNVKYNAQEIFVALAEKGEYETWYKFKELNETVIMWDVCLCRLLYSQ